MNSVVRAAGARPVDAGGERLNVTDCLVFPERPRTPPEQQKYRKSSTMAPGQRFQHYGIADDLRAMNLGDRVYGGNSERATVNAAELINHRLPTELERIQLDKAEQVYRLRAREPLGRTVDRHIELPKKFTEGKLPFGMAGKSSVENAKDVIFPELSQESVDGDEIYRRSHGFSHPGEQTRRGYKWYVDPATTRFGVKGDTIALNGVSKNIADVLRGAGDTPSIINTKKVEDFRNMGDALGRTKNLGQNSAARPFETIYGAGSASMRKSGNVWGAAEVIRGKYSVEQQLPDGDLGKSITPGFRNISLEDRAYGCPSIRDDLPKGNPQRRSLADTQNYGDDVPAQDLINPPAFSDLSIDPLVMRQYRSRDQLLDLFARIGHIFPEAIGEAIFEEAARGYEQATINDFRNAALFYLDAVSQGTGVEASWLRDHGLA